MKRLLVIELTDNEQRNKIIHSEITDVLRRFGGVIKESAIEDIFAVQEISNEQYYRIFNKIDFLHHVKRDIAYKLASFAMENNLIEYTTKADKLSISITGRLNILKFGGVTDGESRFKNDEK